jgi:hypothetical protein
MTRFTLSIQCDNAAFDGDDNEAGIEIARILEATANKVRDYGGLRQEKPLYDINCNSVGKYYYSGKRKPRKF